MSNKSDFDVEGPGKKKKGVYCSTCCVWTTVIFVIAALLAEGRPLMISPIKSIKSGVKLTYIEKK